MDDSTVASAAVDTAAPIPIANDILQDASIKIKQEPQAEESEEEKQSNYARSVDSCAAFEAHEEAENEEDQVMDESDGKPKQPSPQEGVAINQEQYHTLHDSHSFGVSLDHQHQLYAKDKHQHQQITNLPHNVPYNVQPEYVNMADICPKVLPASISPPFMSPNNYQPSTQCGALSAGTKDDLTNVPHQNRPLSPNHQLSSASTYSGPNLKGADFFNQPSIPLTPDGWQRNLNAGPISRAKAFVPPDSRNVEGNAEENDASFEDDDDEPLKTRIKRQPSVLSGALATINSPPVKASPSLQETRRRRPQR